MFVEEVGTRPLAVGMGGTAFRAEAPPPSWRVREGNSWFGEVLYVELQAHWWYPSWVGRKAKCNHNTSTERTATIPNGVKD
jgi:hypothetical protein